MGKRKPKRGGAARTIAKYVSAANAIMLDHFRPDCCINGTRVAVDVLAEFGVRVFPCAAIFTGFNAEFWARMEAVQRYPSEREMHEWCEQGGWSVGVGPGVDDDGGFSGHVVGIANGMIIDSAAGQFNRPAKGIHLPAHAMATPVDDGWQQERATVIDGNEGCVLTYRKISPSVSEASSFRSTPGFQKSAHNDECAAAIIARMKSE